MSRDAYEEAARYFVSVAEWIPKEKWGEHGLGEWTVCDLVGHASRAMLTVETDTAKPSSKPATALSVAEWGREAGKALGAEPVSAVRKLADRVLAKLPTIPDNFRCETPIGVVELADYLPLGVLELVMPTLDIANGTGLDVAVPKTAMAEAIGRLGRSAVRSGDGPLVALALTGRAQLPCNFSLV